jgi:hypothetical protein
MICTNIARVGASAGRDLVQLAKRLQLSSLFGPFWPAKNVDQPARVLTAAWPETLRDTLSAAILGNIMSRGFGRLERMILAAVEAWPASYLIDLLPVAHTRAQAVALERAAINLEKAGKIERGCDRGMVVIRKPANQSESEAPSWEEREEDLDSGEVEPYDMREIRAWREGETNADDDRAGSDRQLVEELGERETEEELLDQFEDD